MTIYPGAWLQNCKNIRGPNRKYSFECWNGAVALFIVSFKKPFSAVKGSAGVSSGAAPITGHVSRQHVRQLLLCCRKTSASFGYKSRGRIVGMGRRKEGKRKEERWQWGERKGGGGTGQQRKNRGKNKRRGSSVGGTALPHCHLRLQRRSRHCEPTRAGAPPRSQCREARTTEERKKNRRRGERKGERQRGRSRSRGRKKTEGGREESRTRGEPQEKERRDREGRKEDRIEKERGEYRREKKKHTERSIASHRLRHQAPASPPAAPGNREEENERDGKQKQKKRKNRKKKKTNEKEKIEVLSMLLLSLLPGKLLQLRR